MLKLLDQVSINEVFNNGIKIYNVYIMYDSFKNESYFA